MSDLEDRVDQLARDVESMTITEMGRFGQAMADAKREQIPGRHRKPSRWRLWRADRDG